MRRVVVATIGRYGLAVLAVAAGLAMALVPAVKDAPGSLAILALLAVLIVARWAGAGPALLTATLIVGLTMHLEPTPGRLARLILFVATAGSLALIVGPLGAARRRAESDARGLRLARAELRRERDFSEAVLEAAGCLFVVLDGDGRIVRFNRAACEATGREADEVLGRPLGEVFPEPVPASFDRRAREGGPGRVEGRCCGESGQERRIDWTIVPLPDEDGRARHVIGAGLDVTARQLAEERVAALNADLARRLGELEAILDLVPAGVGIAEDPTCASIRVNDYLTRLIGLEPGANASLSAGEGERPRYRLLRDGREVPAAELPLQLAAARSAAVPPAEMDLVRDDGLVVPFWMTAVPLFDERGAVRGSVGAFLDVTEQRRAREELLRAKEAAEAAGRAKDLFLAMLSHELRTPLTPALLAATGLLDDPAMPGPVRGALEEIRDSIALEARLVDDLLDATRADAGKLHVARHRVVVDDVVRRALGACAADAAAAGVHLEVELAAGDAAVEGDAARLQQVVWNLVKNACKFTPRGGSVAVRTRRQAACGCGPEAGCAVVEVADTGVGIEPGRLAAIFRPFEQGAEGARRPGGLGLGLAIARAIAEAHGGHLSAASDGPGRGATFSLELRTLPGPAPAEPARPAADGAVAAAGPRRLLLVEDDPATARVLSGLLRRRGLDVATAATLAEARAALADGAFDLVISDLGLPDGPGHDLARWLRDQRPGLPAIALSGFGSDDDVRASRASGFAEHLTKPVDLPALLAAIGRAATPAADPAV